CAGMNVRGDQPVPAHFEALMARDLDVFPDLGDCGDPIRFEARLRIDGELPRNFIAERAERFVLRHEVRFAVDFDQDPDLVAGHDVLNDYAFPGFARGFALGGGHALLAQDVHRGAQVAFRLRERPFAVHQSGVGHFAQFANGSSSDFSHTIGGNYAAVGVAETGGAIGSGASAGGVTSAGAASSAFRRAYFASYSARAWVIVSVTTFKIKRTDRMASSFPAIG